MIMISACGCGGHRLPLYLLDFITIAFVIAVSLTPSLSSLSAPAVAILSQAACALFSRRRSALTVRHKEGDADNKVARAYAQPFRRKRERGYRDREGQA